MEWLVYYRDFPHKELRAIACEADEHETAIKEVAAMLEHGKEVHYKPLIAVALGGKHE